MKISMKILAASVALTTLTMSGAANASIQLTTQYLDGELFMTAWDQAAQQSYSRDLGILQHDFLTNTAQPLSFDMNTLDTGAADTNWTKFITTGSKGVGVVYTVTAANQSWQVPNKATGYTNKGMLITSPSTVADIMTSAGNDQMLANASGAVNMFAQDSNGAAGDPLQDAVSTAVNSSSFSVIGDTGYFGKPTWNINDGGKTFLTIGNIDNSVPFYSLLIQNDYSTVKLTELPNVWKLDKAGNLTYVSAVPVPAAVWLFGSGLLGLVSVARRRKV